VQFVERAQRVERGHLDDADSRRFARDEEQTERIALARLRHHDEEIGNGGVGNEQLAPVEPPAVAFARCTRVELFGILGSACFRDRERRCDFPRADSTQPGPLLCLAAGFGDRQSREHRRQERHRRERTTEFLEHDAEFHHAEPGTTDRLGKDQTRPAQLTQLAPGRGIQLLGSVHHLAHTRHRRPRAQEFARGLAQQLLLFRESGLHRALGSWLAALLCTIGRAAQSQPGQVVSAGRFVTRRARHRIREP
jgi:hypothetical protein